MFSQIAIVIGSALLMVSVQNVNAAGVLEYPIPSYRNASDAGNSAFTLVRSYGVPTLTCISGEAAFMAGFSTFQSCSAGGYEFLQSSDKARLSPKVFPGSLDCRVFTWTPKGENSAFANLPTGGNGTITVSTSEFKFDVIVPGNPGISCSVVGKFASAFILNWGTWMAGILILAAAANF